MTFTHISKSPERGGRAGITKPHHIKLSKSPERGGRRKW